MVSVALVSMAPPGAGPKAAPAERSAAPAPPRAAQPPTPVPKPEPPAPVARAEPKPEPPQPAPPKREPVPLKKPEPKPTQLARKAPEPAKPAERRPEPRPKPKPEPARQTAQAQPRQTPPQPAPARRVEEDYEDVLAQLRAERGETRPSGPARTAAAGIAGASGVAGASARGSGQPLDPEIAVWLRAAKFHVESAWVLPPGLSRDALRTVVSVRLDAGGRVLGPPRITERSTNPWYDESVVRAIQKASPLPPPPEPGEWRFEFTPPRGAG